MPFVIARLREPSTWAGIAALLGLLGVHVAPEVLGGVRDVLTAAAGLALLLTQENKS